MVDINGAEMAHCDMELMKNCKHNIIANSTFSWWGAWLNENAGKVVVCPRAWFGKGRETDIIPAEWVRLP